MRSSISFLLLLPSFLFAQSDPQKLLEKGNEMKGLGNYDSAILYYEYAALEFKKRSALDKELDALNLKGFVYCILGQVEDGFELLNRNLDRGKNINSGINSQVATSLHNIGVGYYMLGQYTEAIEKTLKALEIRKEIFGQHHQDVAKSLNNLGILYENVGELDKGLLVYEQAYEIQKSIYGHSHIEIANSLNNLGSNAYFRGAYDVSLKYYTESLEMYLKLEGEIHPEVASMYNNISTIYNEKRQYQKALDYIFKAKNIYEKLYGKKNQSYLNVVINLSVIYKSLGKYETALDFGLEAKEVALGFYEMNHPVMGQLYQNIGVIYHDIGDWNQAIIWQEKSLQINLSAETKNPLNIAYNFNNLGVTHTDLGNFDQAENYYKKALEYKSKVLGERHVSIASTWNNLEAMYSKKKDYRNAIKAAHQAMMLNHFTFADSALHTSPPIENFSDLEIFITSLITKANAMIFVYKESHDQQWLEWASQHLKKCSQLILNFQATVGSDDKIRFASHVHSMAKVRNYLEQIRYENTTDKRFLINVFNDMELTKGSLLNASIVDSKARKYAGIPAEILEAENALDKAIQTAKQELVLSLDAGVADEEIIQIRDDLFELKNQYESLIQRLEIEYPAYHALKFNLKNVDLKKIQREYLVEHAETAIVEYFEMDSSFFALIITQDELSLKELPAYAYEKNIRGFRNAIIHKEDHQILELGYELYQNLMLPIDKYLKQKSNVTNLVIIPDGILGYLPFEALIAEKTTEKSFHKIPFLLNTYAIKYAVSSTILYSQFEQRMDYGSLDYIGFAPVFSDQLKNNILAMSSQSENSLQEKTVTTRGFVRNGIIVPLPATKIEIEKISKLYFNQKMSAQFYLHMEATEENLKSPQVADYRFVHLATHGFVDDEVPNLSGLVLSQNADTSEDDILYVGEVYNLKWNAELVTLSACETGLGKVVKGEGILGLSRAFMYAGANSVMVSLWSVSDQSTADLMIDFYNNLLTQNNKVVALKNAKQQLLNSKKYAHPFYWAPFILIGH